jgi:GT2 family glycosyltransferase
MKNSTHNAAKLVSIITVNFNQAKVTEELLRSLAKITYEAVEIIVVDNGSKENSFYLKELFPQIKLIRSQQNLGFAGGNNLGIKQAKGEYILLINNDVEVHPNFIEPLIQQLDLDENAIAVSPKIKYFHSPTKIQYAGSYRVNPFTLKNGHRGTGSEDKGQFETTQITDYAHGACMMIPRKTLTKIGLMNEQYFLYYEEQDWCERMIRTGGNIYYVHDSVVFHKESISTGKNSPLKTYYLNRNRILFARKNFKGIQFFVSMLYISCITVPKNTVSNLKSKAHLKALFQAIFWNITHKTTFNY